MSLKTNLATSRNEPKQSKSTAWQITEVSNSEKRHAVNIGNHADLWLLKICYNTKGGSRILKWGVNFCYNVREIKYYLNIWGIRKKKLKKGAQKKGGENSPISPPLDPRLNTVKRLHSTPNFHFSKHGMKCSSALHRAWSKERPRVSQRTKIKRVHNSHEPFVSRTLIYWYNKNNYIFPCLASFQSKINPVYQKRRRNADCKESFICPSHSAKFGAPTARWHFKNSCANLFTLSLLSKWIRLSVIKALNTMNRRSQDLHSSGFLPR